MFCIGFVILLPAARMDSRNSCENLGPYLGKPWQLLKALSIIFHWRVSVKEWIPFAKLGSLTFFAFLACAGCRPGISQLPWFSRTGSVGQLIYGEWGYSGYCTKRGRETWYMRIWALTQTANNICSVQQVVIPAGFYLMGLSCEIPFICNPVRSGSEIWEYLFPLLPSCPARKSAEQCLPPCARAGRALILQGMLQPTFSLS